jgi:hypothetical protein
VPGRGTVLIGGMCVYVCMCGCGCVWLRGWAPVPTDYAIALAKGTRTLLLPEQISLHTIVATVRPVCAWATGHPPPPLTPTRAHGSFGRARATCNCTTGTAARSRPTPAYPPRPPRLLPPPPPPTPSPMYSHRSTPTRMDVSVTYSTCLRAEVLDDGGGTSGADGAGGGWNGLCWSARVPRGCRARPARRLPLAQRHGPCPHD